MTRGKSFSIWMKAKMTERTNDDLKKTIAALLVEAGWFVYLVRSATALNPGKKQYHAKKRDIFGSDIIAMKPSRVICFIQIKSGPAIGQKIKKFQRYPFPWEFCRILIFHAKKVSGRWKFRVGRADAEGLEWDTQFFLEDILGDVFWKRKNFFLT